jgi:hypothetical protein
METFTAMFKSNVSKNTRLLIDCGCNTNIIASPLHSDIPITYRDSKEGISTANGQIIPIIGQGSVLHIPADYVLTFVDSLLSVSQVINLNDGCFIFLKDKTLNVCLNPSIIKLLSQIHSLAVEEHLILYTANITKYNFYAVNTHTDHTIPSTYYQTAKFYTVPDIVQYFHQACSHCSPDLMIHIIKNKILFIL